MDLRRESAFPSLLSVVPTASAATITVDGRSVSVKAGATLLEALTSAGAEVPHLCHDPRLKPGGLCRLCVVELEGVAHPVTSCTTQVESGMVIRSISPALAERRRVLLEMLAQQQPNDSASEHPHKPLSRYFQQHAIVGRKSPHEGRDAIDTSHPYLRVDMSRCITCLRCVRICAEVQGQFVWHAVGRGDEVKIVPDRGKTLLESSCVSCGACADTCPTGAIEDKSVWQEGAATASTRTTCPYCGTGCEMDVGTRAGRIVSSVPALDSPVNKGHLCVKGRYAFSFTSDAERVTEPLIRGAQGWQKVSWDEALDFVARGFARIQQKYGPDSVGVLGSARATNEDNYVAQKFARVVLGTNNVDCCARVCHGPTAAAMSTMLGTGAATNSYDDIELSRLILICGSNPTECHPIVGARIKQAALHGVPLIVIDPRRTELARVARFHLRLRAGTNVPLLHSMAHVIIEEELFDAGFTRDRVTGLAELRKHVAQFAPEKVAAVTGVEPALVRSAARAYALTAPAMMFHGLGVTEHTEGTEGVECLVNLALLTGNLGKEGSGVNPLRGQNNVQGSAHMGCEPSHLTGYADLEQARSRFAEAWGVPLPAAPGLNMLRMLDKAGGGSFRGLLTIGYDVALTNPDANSTARSLQQLELLVVQDLFMNETARTSAHVFLPASSSFEKDGTFMNSERRVQRVRKVIEPVGNARADFEITCALAARMGHAREFAFTSAEEVWDEVRAVWPAGRGITYARLERAGLQWPCPSEDHPGTKILHQGTFSKGPLAALACVPYVPTTECTDSDFPMILITGRSLYQFNAGTMTERSGNATLRPRDLLEVCAEDAERLHLVTGDEVFVVSRYGRATLPVWITDNVNPGEVFATFHTIKAFLNRVTSPHRDRVVDTPEYKVTAVRIERASTSLPANPV